MNYDSHDEGRSTGLYAQLEFALASDLLLNAGLRYDYHENFGATVNPRLGVIYSPWQSGAFKLLYGEAYRAPNAYERLDAPGLQKPDPELGPETIATYEAIYEQYLGHHVRISISGYRYEVEDLISESLDPVESLRTFLNVEAVSAQGLELEIERRLEGGLLIRASYALQRAEESQGDLAVLAVASSNRSWGILASPGTRRTVTRLRRRSCASGRRRSGA